MIFHTSHASARCRHETPLPWQTSEARRSSGTRSKGSLQDVSHASSNHDPAQGQHWKNNSMNGFSLCGNIERRRRARNFFFPCVTVMQISLCPPRSMSQPGEKNTFPLIPPPTFDLIISALLLRNRPEHKAGG